MEKFKRLGAELEFKKIMRTNKEFRKKKGSERERRRELVRERNF